MNRSRLFGGALALAALALPLGLAAAAPAAATESDATVDQPTWYRAVFAFDKDKGDWGGDQTLVYLEQLDAKPAKGDVLNIADDPAAFPREVCDYKSVQVDNFLVSPGQPLPVVGEDFHAPFTFWHVEDWAWYQQGVDQDYTDLCATTPVTAAAPTALDECEPTEGTTPDRVTIPETEGVEYALDGAPVEPGDHAVEGAEAVVTATALEGYALEGDAEWTFAFTKDACESPTTPPSETTPPTTEPTTTEPAVAPAPSTTAPAVADSGETLATTGAEDVVPLAVAALALAGLGGALLARRRATAGE